MSWNYRIVKRQRGEEVQYELVEAYYDRHGRMDGYTENPCSFVGDTAMEVVESLLHANGVMSKWVVDESMKEIETVFGGPITEKMRKRRERFGETND